MLVSFIIPIYKVEPYLRECVDSVLNQDYPNLEVVLVDDGSPDSCPAICDEYVQKDNRVKVIHKQNEGLSSARNDGLNAASGEYVVFLDSDDFHSNPHFLSEVYPLLKDGETEVLFFPRTTFNDDTNVSTPAPLFSAEQLREENTGRILKELSQKDILETSAALKVIKRKYLIDNQIYFKKGIYSEDIDWFIRLIIPINKISLSNSISYQYRLRGGSISHNVRKKNIEDLFYSIETHADECKALNDENIKAALLNIIAYNYSIVIGLSGAHLSNNDRKEMLGKARKYTWVLRYGISRKVKMSRILYSIVGLNLMSKVLGFYITKKRTL